MPMYAYACKDCGHAFDIQQSFTEDSLTVCPECRGTLRKKFNSVGVVFKGSGFYRTDSRSTSSSVPAAATSGSSGSEPGASTAGAGSSNAGTTGTGSASSSTAAKTPAKVSAGS